MDNNDIVDPVANDDVPIDFNNEIDYIVPLVSEEEIPERLRRLEYYRAKEKKALGREEAHIAKARSEAEDYLKREIPNKVRRSMEWNEALARKFIINQKDSVRTCHFPTGTIKRMARTELVIHDEDKALEELREACPAAIKTVPETYSIDKTKALKYCKTTGDALNDAIEIKEGDSYTIDTSETERIKQEKKQNK